MILETIDVSRCVVNADGGSHWECGLRLEGVMHMVVDDAYQIELLVQILKGDS